MGTLAQRTQFLTTGSNVETCFYGDMGKPIFRRSVTCSTTRTALLLSYWPFYEVDRQNGDAVMTSYYFGGQRIAQKASGGVLTFLHSDHVGSVRVTSTGSGANGQRRNYQAFGRTRTGGGDPFASRWRFTGQEEEQSGLVYMHARYYDPVTGRFISPDSIVPEPGKLLAYNRYLYAYADPHPFDDSSEHPSLDQQRQERFCRRHGCYPTTEGAIYRLSSLAMPGAVSTPPVELLSGASPAPISRRVSILLTQLSGSPRILTRVMAVSPRLTLAS